MSFRAPSPPSTGYSIIDIRNSCLDMFAMDSKHIVNNTEDIKPPSPPQSSGISEDAFNSSDLVDTILDSLDKPLNHKSIPTFILYDKKGLQLFDQITQLDDEYYLTGAEHDILVTYSTEIVDRLQDGSVIFELGAGSLRKTQVILNAIEKKKVRVTYYALDLDQHELDRSLASLGSFEYVELYGLLGTYDQGIPWISKNFTSSNIQKNFLWMGSSIGNQTRLESAMFLRKLKRMCMEPGDFFMIGFDKRNDAAKIELAYDDSHGVTREFIMNGLDHVNRIMDKEGFLNREFFDYHSIYQEKQGRHLSHYRALKDMTISYKTTKKDYTINIQKDELIHVEHSYKYSLEEIQCILTTADLNMVDYWVDSKDQYRLVLAENRPFIFECNAEKIRKVLYPPNELFEQEPIHCYHCNEGQFEQPSATEAEEIQSLDYCLLKSNKTWPIKMLPSKHEWQELWKSWDLVTQHMIDHKTMLFECPIALRHPFIFYLGHIPSFLDIQMSRHQVDKEIGKTDLTEPKYFADIFERGIDPDMDDPTQCHPHSEVPTEENDWPSIESILTYQKSVRQRLQRLLTFWEDEGLQMQSTDWINSKPERKRQARIIWMCFEHEALHLETLLYMLVQSPNILPPKGIAVPNWKLLLQKDDTNETSANQISPLSDASFLKIPSGTVTIGHDDYEAFDLDVNNKRHPEFGWDNENPKRNVAVDAFEIQTRPVTNGEYYVYLQETNKNQSIPASWISKENNQIYVKTVFGLCPLVYAQHWPVQISYNEAEAYAQYKNARLPSESELCRFREHMTEMCVETNEKWPKYGFKNWYPSDVDNESIHILGDVWEWTNTIWDKYDGFEASKIYPGYSSDFFDGKHRVVLGASWATHPRIAERKTFRNWYQSGYPYVFSGFRLCH
ncbi:uncharacterized protein BX663DRAFT_504955 [Cokeromyces recurvatus]|uniref:uncharacterized protein n=1 Tax=Cokeromyces recurvatus TaxID=90255 RepID=UPI00221E3A3A|nr:uncharacterized protein BX663DRAFT_504955 [Cokeromyces recurvatus]KAI7904403.1 hypothetical protein BX663DRAFT_504955 [Cokeromyces recurvatus]